MLINKNTTLEELIKLKIYCTKIAEKNMGRKSYMCDGCQYFDPPVPCRISDIVPSNWLLPHMGMNLEEKCAASTCYVADEDDMEDEE